MSTTEDQVRSGYTLGLRKLADILDAHPEIPLPAQGDDDISPIYIGFWHDDAKDRLAEAARVFPCSWDKEATDRHFNLNGRLGGLHVQLTASRDRVCTRIVTGTEDREVEEVVEPAVTRKVVKRVEVVEWQCGSLLADREPAAALAGEMDAEITRQRPSEIPVTHYASSTEGLAGDITPRIACGTTHWGIVSHDLSMVDCVACLQTVCGRCGATRAHGVLVTSDGVTRCNNQVLCAERAAARDDLRPGDVRPPQLHDEVTACEHCGSTTTPLTEDRVCWNSEECGRRQDALEEAARDAEAQVRA